MSVKTICSDLEYIDYTYFYFMKMTFAEMSTYFKVIKALLIIGALFFISFSSTNQEWEAELWILLLEYVARSVGFE